MNEQLANIFDDMATEFKDDRFRHRAYQNAAAAIRRHPNRITSGAQAQKEIAGVGKSIAAKIDEVIRTGKLQFLEQRPPEKKEKAEVIKIFEKIYGVGPVTAEKWYDRGYHTLEDLAKVYGEMTAAQQLGYHYYHQLNTKIPRQEIKFLDDLLKTVWNGVTFEITGSYRRGEAQSSDIDIIVKNATLNFILQPLIDRGMILGHLAHGANKYLGIIKIHDIARRIDILLVDEESWPYALLHFTGSKQLNVMMRTKAQAMGLSMNEFGMTDEKGKKYLAKTEEDIFNYLGIPYLPPNQRSVLYKAMKPTNIMTAPIGAPPLPVPTNAPAPVTAAPPPITAAPPAIAPAPIAPVPVKNTGGQWYNPVATLHFYLSNGMQSTGHIAAFDLDWTLVRTFQNEFHINPTDITPLPNRINILRKLKNEGYTIVIFTNQKSTGKRIPINKARIEHFVNMIPDIPVIVFMATGPEDDQYRKPNQGMYDILKRILNPIKSIFYVGNEAGRPTDKNDSDRQFALNGGMKFYTPEEIFPPIERFKPDPRGVVDTVELPADRVMVMLMGMPGSGKTTYYQQNLAPLGYIHLNQDILKTKAKVLSETKKNMGLGLSVCLDATNPGQDRRQEFYDIAQQYGYNVVLIYITRDGRGYNKLRPNPVPKIAYSTYYSNLVEPTPANTPGALYQIF